MSIANKSFKDNRTGEVIKVIDAFENIAILENKQKIDVRKLMDSNLYTEQIDVNNFFNTQGAYNHLAEKIKNIPTENIIDDDRGNMVIENGFRVPTSNIGGMPVSNESAVIMSNQDDERAELARKYGAIDNQSSVQNQNAAFAKILGEGAEDELPKVQQPIRQTEVRVDGFPSVQNTTTYQQPVQNDPVTNMFKNVKRNVSFKMNIEISNKIPRLDFIEMMEDSYEISIIDFLAEEFTQNLLRNPSQIKEMIKDKITKVVYGAGVKLEKPEEVKEEPKKVVKKQASKKVSTRKPKVSDKKEEVKND